MSIIIKEMTKTFEKKSLALDNLDLSISSGLFGLLGKNGAGKTTLLRILTTIYTHTKGTVVVSGLELNKTNANVIKGQIGYLPQEYGFYRGLTVAEALDYMGILNRMSKVERTSRIAEVLQLVHLEQEKKKKVQHLSGGMKRRLGLAQALLNKPNILIVDEPTAGVDPEERITIRNILSEYARDHLVILSTHIIEDIEMTCDQLAIIDQGKLKFSGTVNELLKQAVGTVWQTELLSRSQLENLKRDYFVLSSQRVGEVFEAKVISRREPEVKCYLVQPSIEDAYMLLLQDTKTKEDGAI